MMLVSESRLLLAAKAPLKESQDTSGVTLFNS